jgi:hypothetical protein
MARLIAKVNSTKTIKFSKYKQSHIYIDDNELQFIEKLIDNRMINRLLAHAGQSSSILEIFPSSLFRAELLKAFKFPEISNRKFCTQKHLGLDWKQNRVFFMPLA